MLLAFVRDHVHEPEGADQGLTNLFFYKRDSPFSIKEAFVLFHNHCTPFICNPKNVTCFSCNTPLTCSLELNSGRVALSEGMSHLVTPCIGAFAFSAHTAMPILSNIG